MSEENLLCPICGGLHPAGHRDKELEDRLEAIGKICYSKRAPANEKIADIIHTLEATG